jgi:hypothetical protein
MRIRKHHLPKIEMNVLLGKPHPHGLVMEAELALHSLQLESNTQVSKYTLKGSEWNGFLVLAQPCPLDVRGVRDQSFLCPLGEKAQYP